MLVWRGENILHPDFLSDSCLPFINSNSSFNGVHLNLGTHCSLTDLLLFLYLCASWIISYYSFVPCSKQSNFKSQDLPYGSPHILSLLA